MTSDVIHVRYNSSSMNLYHVLNRGVDKRTIFLDNQDHARFVHDIFEFNSTEPAINSWRRSMNDVGRHSLIGRPKGQIRGERLVDIHGWCLMGNHYHLLLSERVEGGMSLFLKKLNGGYAKYFNERYERAGALFQGRTKRILVDTDAYFLHILNYVHFNPLDMLVSTQEWRLRKITKPDVALVHLKNYRWSSYRDYIGIKNFPSILTTTLFQGVFNNDYLGQVERYLGDISVDKIRYLMLE